MEENLLKERKQILMDIMKSKEYQPMKVKELAMVLNVPKEDREELRYVLNELMNEGKIVESKKGKFSNLTPVGSALTDAKVIILSKNLTQFSIFVKLIVPEYCLNSTVLWRE